MCIRDRARTVARPQRVVDGLPVELPELDSYVTSAGIPTDAQTLVRVFGGVAAAAGVAFALNRAPRFSAGALLLSSTIALGGRRRIWELEGKERLEELGRIAGDLGLLGGVLLAVVDTDGKPGLAWRVDHAIERGQKIAENKRKDLEKAQKAAERSRSAKKLDKKLAKKIKKA